MITKTSLKDLTCGVVLYSHNQSTISTETFCAKGSDLTGQPLTVDTPLRIASNTKTFTAAAILRLLEMGELSLDDAISRHIDPEFNQLLNDRYATDSITIRNLLNHSSGLYDHADERYLKFVLTRPNYQWSRLEQVQLYTRKKYPFVPPSTSFIYSDTGYILLGDVIERLTGKSLGHAVRELLKFDEIGLATAYWEYLEQPTTKVPRARQYLKELEGTHIHASMDVYGGGGLIMSSRQMAQFLEALFNGKVFEHAETLNTMLSAGSHEGGQSYRLGIMASVVNGVTLYSHLGFWGSVAYYAPETKISAAGFVDDKESREKLVQIIEALLT
ncbi:serine hydrolase domain-containing protein [Providencia burhodogranariea]|uniref:Beta-lactamase class C n=1 Tax=Providencia burhodogranariea DSM 19968 TaxID=1141662 RepID=K8WLQ0_9GAMM|nr:serine hydrolase domain-containing protein [Providencia burhodogranariea]EKT57110.1 beta-lactamase class C [Providencia burhodogranariea DSM 19968]